MRAVRHCSFDDCVTELSFVMQFSTAVPVIHTNSALEQQLGAGMAAGLATPGIPRVLGCQLGTDTTAGLAPWFEFLLWGW